MKGFILAAGFGKRMGDLTKDKPKPLLPVNGIPLIYYSLFQLFRWGLRETFINLHYRGDMIERELQDFPHMTLRFSHEKEILGTAGGLRKVLGQVEDEWLLVLNPDTVMAPAVAMDPGNLAVQLTRTRGDLLGLAPRKSHENVSAIQKLEDDTLRFEEHAPYYYMGYSFVRCERLRSLPAESFAEMGTIWRVQAAAGELRGFEYEGGLWDAGTEGAYYSLPGLIFEGEMAEEFTEFLSYRRQK
ncbi:MAG: NTP transferase domain-containing protein [Leptospirales bacterium]|nr:NTP transferase domain-containing protein [Leptospirales bacterium]